MRRVVCFIITLWSGVVMLSLFGAPVWAQTNGANIMGGNNASDYQPPTRNPQENVANLNQTGGNLQPQNSVTQTSLPSVGDLRVPGVSGAPNTNTTKTSKPETVTKSINYWPISIIALLTLLAMIYVIVQPDPTKQKRRTLPPEPAAVPTSAPTAATAKKTPKKPAKKSAAKRRSKSGKKRR
jgi:hypothetical protein